MGRIMTRSAAVELTDLVLPCSIGTYGPQDTVPEAHVLDLTLHVDPELVQVPGDGMDHVFDYDPLIAHIETLARDGHYDTQEWLMTRIVQACAACPQIESLSIGLRKHPVRNGSGVLGMRLALDKDALNQLRAKAA